ncbi:MAG: cache domain-containing protein, partial [Gammaproteobacteria bacterium]
MFVLGLLASVLGVVLYAVNTANEREARRHIDEALTLTAGAFRRSLLARERILLEKARLLSSDFAFKQAAATRDHPTLLSALENHRARVAAAVMMLLELDGTVIADTLHPTAHGDATSLMRLRDAAMTSEHGDAASIESLDDRYYQLVMVPLFTPEPTAWIVIGFAMGDDFALELQRETRTHVTLLTETRDGWIPFSSTLTRDRLEALGEGRLDEVDGGDANITLELGGEVFVTAVQHVSVEPARPVLALLQRS